MDELALDLVREGAVTIKEAVHISGFGKTFLYEAMKRGDLPYIKIGSARRIPRKGLAMWLASGLHIKGEKHMPAE